MDTTQLKNIILTNKEGFTTSFNKLEMYTKNKGFAVSITNIKGKNINNLISSLLKVSGGFSQMHDKLFIGGWYNVEDNLFYLDLSIITNNKQEVKFMLKRFNQISAFSFMDFKAYKLEDL